MQGTGFGDFQHHTHQNSSNELAAHGQTIQARAILKEQRQIIKFIRLERFQCFIFWTYSSMLSKIVVPALKEKDFLYKRCNSGLKRLRQLIYSINYLINNKPQRKQQMYQCYNNIRTFLLDTIELTIDNFQSILA